MPKILVVDDRVTNRQILTKLAETLEEGCEVESFADPVRALSWAAQSMPDLVISDYKMPQLNGAEFVRRFREQLHATHVPVIVVTAYEDRQFRYEALSAGATDYLLSPLDAVEFRARARNLLTMRRQHEIIDRRNLLLEQRLEERSRVHEQELQLTEQRFQLVLNTVPLMISVVDRDGLCHILNNEQCRIFCIDPQESLGHSLEEVFGRDYAQTHREMNNRIFEAGKSILSFEEVLSGKDGERLVFVSTKSPLIDSTGRPISVATISMDITARKGAERELAEAKELAEDSNRAKTEFLANISHELRTPLNAIIGFSEMMRYEHFGPMGAPKYKEYSNDICESAKHLLAVINDLLDLSQIEGGKFRLVQRDVALDDVLREVGRILQPQSDAAGVELRFSVDDPLPGIRGDALRLKQALLNIASNALKFTAAGGTVDITATTCADHVDIEVVDTGIGMSEADIRLALTRFGRVETVLARRYPGVGLGLPLAADFVRLHGGRLDISSIPNQGTCVTISLPTAHPGDQQDRLRHVAS